MAAVLDFVRSPSDEIFGIDLRHWLHLRHHRSKTVPQKENSATCDLCGPPPFLVGDYKFALSRSERSRDGPMCRTPRAIL